MFAILFALILQVYIPLSAVENCEAFGVPVSGVGYDSAWREYMLTADGIAAVLALDASRSFWVGYERGGFAPAYFESEPALTLTLYTVGGGERWVDITEAGGVYYVLPFANTVAYADANGEHYGTHPCAAILMTGAEYEALLGALRGER